MRKRFFLLPLIGIFAMTAFAQRGGGGRSGGSGHGGGARTMGSFSRGGFSSGGFRSGGAGRGSGFSGGRIFSGGLGRLGFGRYGGFRGYYGGWYPGFAFGWGSGYGYGYGYDPFYYGYPYYGSSYYNYPSYGYSYAQPPVVISGSGYYGQNNVQVPDDRDYNYSAPRSGVPEGVYEDSRPPSGSNGYTPALYLIALKDRNVRSALTYWVENGSLYYVTVDHEMKQIPLGDVDREQSERLNRERHLNFRLPPGQ